MSKYIATIKGGTVIIAIWTPDEVVLAADSADNELVDGKFCPVGSMCKLRRLGSFVFGVKGIRCEDGSGFDAIAIAEQVIEQGGPFLDVLKRLAESLPPELNRAGDELRKNNSLDFERVFSDAPLELVVATNQEPLLWLGHIRFRTCWTGLDFKVVPDTQYCPSPLCTEESKEVPLASAANLLEYRKLPKAENYVDRARAFVEFMIQQGEEGVAFPVKVFRVTTSTICEI